MQVLDVLNMGPVLPVVTLDDVRHAVPLARALLAGGIRTVEVTLRTPGALDSVRAIRQDVPELCVGVGTVTTPAQVDAAVQAGAQFGVSPGLTAALAGAVRDADLPFLPGTMTPSDVMHAHAAGFRALKLFPATAAGGVGMLRALGPVFADVLFCPTGGISAAGAPEYLALPNVRCVGGSWVAPAGLLAAGDWAGIEALARAAAALRAPD